MDKPQGGLTPGGLAMIIRCKGAPENIGKIVTTVRCVGELTPGQTVEHNGEIHVARGSRSGVVWAIECPSGIVVPRILKSTRERLDPGRATHALIGAMCLMPINPEPDRLDAEERARHFIEQGNKLYRELARLQKGYRRTS